jgi:hypothetical protein
MMTDEEYEKFHEDRWDELDMAFKSGAVAMLQAEFPAKVKRQVLKSYRKHGKLEWIHAEMQHFGWGMAVRNLLRDKGFLDNMTKTGNLDDYYVQLVEAAVGARDFLRVQE